MMACISYWVCKWMHDTTKADDPCGTFCHKCRVWYKREMGMGGQVCTTKNNTVLRSGQELGLYE